MEEGWFDWTQITFVRVLYNSREIPFDVLLTNLSCNFWRPMLLITVRTMWEPPLQLQFKHSTSY